MARSTLTCFQRSQWRFRSMKASPAAQMISATSRGGRLIYFSPMGLSLMDFPRSARRRADGGVALSQIKYLRDAFVFFAQQLLQHFGGALELTRTHERLGKCHEKWRVVL